MSWLGEDAVVVPEGTELEVTISFPQGQVKVMNLVADDELVWGEHSVALRYDNGLSIMVVPYVAMVGVVATMTDVAKGPQNAVHTLDVQNGGPNTNTGHGHVWRRPDGGVYRCGGVKLCGACERDAEEWHL